MPKYFENIRFLKAFAVSPQRLFYLLLCIAISFPVLSVAQKSKRKIEILGADDFYYDEIEGVKAKRLIGNVRIKHETTIMHCDSAYVFSKSNTMKAYGNVHITDPDSMDLWGDSLKYFGESKITEVRGDVKLVNPDFILTTHFLNFDRTADLVYYWGGGKILMNQNQDTLWSKKGYYYSKLSEMHFKDSVVMITDDYRITSDTMHYNSNTERSSFFGPTNIVSEENHIYTEKGWSNNKTGVSEFTTNSYINTEDQQIWGDSILYNQKTKIGELFYNVTLLDTSNDFMVQGEFVLHNQEDSTSLVLGKPMLTQFMGEDSLYLHADTLFSHFDTTGTFRIIHAYPHAQFYKTDMQGKCDSLLFSDEDSTIRMYYDPILWSEANQITADFIQIFRKKGEIDRMTMDNKAFIISLEDSLGQFKKYNQIKGDSMIGYFKKGELSSVFVNHSGNTLYFAKDEEEKDSTGMPLPAQYIGMNKAICDNMTIYLDSSAVKEIVFRIKPDATLYPLKDVTPRMMYLKEFKWREQEQPKRKEDIFNWVDAVVEDKKGGKKNWKDEEKKQKGD